MRDFIEQVFTAAVLVVGFILAATIAVAVIMAPFVLAARFWSWIA